MLFIAGLIIYIFLLIVAIYIIFKICHKNKSKPHNLTGYIFTVITLLVSQYIFKIMGDNLKNIPYQYNIDYIMLMAILFACAFIYETIKSYVKNGRYSRKAYYLQHCIYKIWINIISIYGILFAGVMTLSDVSTKELASKSDLTLLYAMFLIVSVFISVSFNASIFHHAVNRVKNYNEKHGKYKCIQICIPNTIVKTSSGKKLHMGKHKIFAYVKIQ